MIRLSDTSAEAEQVLRQAYRDMPFARKWHLMGATYRTARMLHAAGVRQRNPEASATDIQTDWRLRQAIDILVPQAESVVMNGQDENVAVVEEVIRILDRLRIPYAVGGSWATSLYGKMRFTHDADLTVEPFAGKERDLVSAFGKDFYVSLSAVEDAVQRRSCFNIINVPISYKVDIFVRRERSFDQSVMARRQVNSLAGMPGAVFVVSPEDIILFKLEWFRLGGESSERQWLDILGVFEIQAEKLDQAYLKHWAQDLGVSDLLERARTESGL